MLTLKGLVLICSIVIVMIINVSLILTGSFGIINGIKMRDYTIATIGLFIGIFNSVILLNAITMLIDTLKTYGIV